MSHFLSSIPINPLRRRGNEVIANPHTMFAYIQQANPRTQDDSTEAGERVLWRLEHDGRRARVLALTPEPYSWAGLVEELGWPGAPAGEAVTKPYDRILESVRDGAEYAFKVRANPVSATKAPTGESARRKYEAAREARGGRARGRRVAHRTPSQQIDWFLARAASWGFEVVAAPLDGDGESVPVINITERQRLEFSKARKPSDGPAMADGSSSVDASSEQARGGGGRTRVVLSTAVFEGRLRVSDEALFTRALLGGVGASKAHGCGLLTVVPVAGV